MPLGMYILWIMPLGTYILWNMPLGPYILLNMPLDPYIFIGFRLSRSTLKQFFRVLPLKLFHKDRPHRIRPNRQNRSIRPDRDEVSEQENYHFFLFFNVGQIRPLCVSFRPFLITMTF